MKKVKEGKSENDFSSLNDIEQKEMIEFLSQINSTIADIRKSDQKQYSLLSSIFNCFYENKKISLPRQTIYEYIHKDIINYKGKMITSFVRNGSNSMKLINEDNYIKTAHNIIYKNKCLVQENDNCISININFIQNFKNLIFRNMFGKEGTFFNATTIKFKKKTKDDFTDNKSNKKEKRSLNSIDEIIVDKDNYEIEIIESEQDETDTTELKKGNNNININTIENINTTDNNIIINKNINNLNIPLKEKKYLNKKRKSHSSKNKIKKEKDNELQYNNIFNDIINNNEYNKDEKSDISFSIMEKEEENGKEKNEEIVAEKEILSLIEEGKLFLSLFKDQELLNQFETQNNTQNDCDYSFIKSNLLNYQNGEVLKSYLNIINDDYTEFQNSLKNLINYHTSLDGENSNKFLEKISIMNKIILEKEKCNLLIDKITIKLKQLILEYNFIKKMLNGIEANKVDIFQRFKDVMANGNNKEEKENYINDVKAQLQKELSKVVVLSKEQKDKEK